MATTRDVVNAAADIAGVSADDKPLDNASAAKILKRLNKMLRAWNGRGVNLNHTDLGLDDTFTISVTTTDEDGVSTTTDQTSELEDHIEFILARRIAPLFGVRLDPDTLIQARRAERLFNAVARLTQPVKVDPALRQFPSQYWGASRYR